MLQYPTNIYPDGSTFDSSVVDANNAVSFTFNGDFLTGILYRTYNYNTGEIVLYNDAPYPAPKMGNNLEPICYNGSTFKSDNGLFNQLQNGEDYGLQMLLLQFTQDGSAPLCDMFVLRGLTKADYTVGDGHIVIKEDIANIYEWDVIHSDGRYPTTVGNNLVDIMQVVIDGQRKTITAYNNHNGNLILNSDLLRNLPAGTPYQIYANYKVSPLYFFKCRTIPTTSLALSTQASPLRHHVEGTYSQSQNSLINYYSIALYGSDTHNGNTGWRKVDETEHIYSQNISYDFYDDFILRYKYAGAEETYQLYYKAVVTIKTIDGMVITQDSNVINCGGILSDCATTTVTLYPQDYDRADTFYSDSHMEKHSIRIDYTSSQAYPTGTEVMFYRENVQTGETEIIESGEDISVPTKGKYRYYIVPRDQSGSAYLKGIGFTEIDLDMRGYTITELILMPEIYQWGTRPRYKIGNQWKFVGEVQDTTVTQNTDRYLHVGYATYPTLTLTKTNYMSGTLSAMNGYVNCTTHKYVDDIDLIRAWREFITRPTIYMLKSQKGDVWIVNVTDNPTTTYQEMIKGIPTTFSFNWTECCDVKDIKILDHTAST